MDRKYNLRLDLQFRCNNSTMKFDELDKNTSDFFIRLTKAGKVIDINNAIVTLVAIKPSKQVEAQFIEVKNNKVYADLKSSMKDEIGKYSAIASIVLEGETVNTDVFEYEVLENKFLKQLNNEVVSEERFTILTDMINRLSTIEANEENRENNFETIQYQWNNLKSEFDNYVLNKVDERVDEVIVPIVDDKVTSLTKQVVSDLEDRVTLVDEKIKEVNIKVKEVEATKTKIDTDVKELITNTNTNTSKLITDTKTDIDNYKTSKNTEIDNYKTSKDLEIDNKVNTSTSSLKSDIDKYKESKNTEIDNYKNAKDTLINNKIKEVEEAKQDVIKKSNDKIIELDNKKNELTNTVNEKVSEADTRIETLSTFESQLETIESKNTEQDTRLNTNEYINKRQDVMMNGLFNENADGRLSIEGVGNSVKLENSKDGVVEVDRVVGDTLVNLIKSYNYSIKQYDHVCMYKKGMLKPDTLYTSIIYNPSTIASLSFYWNEQNKFPWKRIQIPPSSIVISTNTTVSNIIESDNVTLFKNELHYDELIEFKVILLEGDYTNKPIPSEYFEGMQSTFEDNLVTQQQVDTRIEKVENLGKYKAEIEVVGKDKFDGKKEFLINDNGHAYLEFGDSNKTYTVSLIDKNPNLSISDVFFGLSETKDSGASWLISLNIINRSITANKRFLRCYPRSKLKDVLERFDILVEEGTVATPYEPYKEFKQPLYINEPLYQDNELCINEGKLGYWKNREKVTFMDSTTPFAFHSNQSGINTLLFTTPNTNAIQRAKLSCDMFSPTSDLWLPIADYEGVSITSNGFTQIRILKSKLSTQDAVGFKAWLQANPTTIIYELAEPIFIPILENTPKWILEGFNDCTVTFNSNVPVLSSSFTYTGNIPSVYNMDKSITTMEEHNVDMVATSWDMDYRLLEVEWAIEDITGVVFNLNNIKIGGKNMALSRFEQAKIMILGGAYDKATLTKQLNRYLEKKILTQTEYDELIALMEAKELVTGE